jgi:hypothetical protein
VLVQGVADALARIAHRASPALQFGVDHPLHQALHASHLRTEVRDLHVLGDVRLIHLRGGQRRGALSALQAGAGADAVLRQLVRGLLLMFMLPPQSGQRESPVILDVPRDMSVLDARHVPAAINVRVRSFLADARDLALKVKADLKVVVLRARLVVAMDVNENVVPFLLHRPVLHLDMPDGLLLPVAT